MKNEFILNDKKFRAFCIYRLLFGISYSIMIPIIPLFFKSIGMETVTIGMVISLYGVSKTIMQIPFGIVCDKIGDKLTLKLALLLMGLVPIGYILSNTSLQAGSLYVIQGAILGMAAPATYSVLARTLNVKRRGECTGLASAVFTLGGGIGAAIASFILTKLNNFSMAFNISSLGIFFTLIYVIIRVNKVKPMKDKDNKKESIKEILYEIRRRKFVYKALYLHLCRNQKFFSCVCTRPPGCSDHRSRDRARPFQAYGYLLVRLSGVDGHGGAGPAGSEGLPYHTMTDRRDGARGAGNAGLSFRTFCSIIK